jgi:hypothetical protein
MTSLKTSLSWVDSLPHPDLRAGVHHISDVMPRVLDRYGLSLEQKSNSVRPTLVVDASDSFDVMLACLESALAS